MPPPDPCVITGSQGEHLDKKNPCRNAAVIESGDRGVASDCTPPAAGYRRERPNLWPICLRRRAALWCTAMAPKHHPTPLSGGDRKALSKELVKARAMTGFWVWQWPVLNLFRFVTEQLLAGRNPSEAIFVLHEGVKTLVPSCGR